MRKQIRAALVAGDGGAFDETADEIMDLLRKEGSR
jgi:hypothetical protein